MPCPCISIASCRPSRPAGRRCWAEVSNGASTANTRTLDIAHAATAIAPSAKAWHAKYGWSSAAQSYCPPSIFTWSSPSRNPSPPSPSTTKNQFTIPSSAPPPRLCSPLPATPSAWAWNSASSRCCIAGDRTCIFILTCTAWFREAAYAAGQLQFFGELEGLRDPAAFTRSLAPVKNKEWVVYAKAPFGGPQHVLEYLGRYTHRVAISNRRLLALQDGQVSFAWKDYRDQQQPQKVMTVSAEEFIRRFLQHSLPPGFQRIRYFGFLANCHRTDKLVLCRQLLATPCSQWLPQPTACRNYHAALIAGNPRLCPRCGVGIPISIQTLWPCHGPVPLHLDSS